MAGFKAVGVLALAASVGTVAVHNGIDPESSSALWMQAPPVVVEEEPLPEDSYVNHGSSKTYGSVLVDVNEPIGPPEMDDYPVGPPQSNADSTSKNYGLVTGK